ncbi:hypothetical protein [Halomonas alkalicola]|uniref:hypothetical protein n=1 Tax=Halomonas alkalicola TaxID=1930622 RepID=UPI00265E295A|nr:hypothetical protein [Halomonas alkalicola]
MQAFLVEDAGRVGALLQVEVYKRLGSGAGDAYQLQVLLTGPLEQDMLTLERAVIVEPGRPGSRFDTIEATINLAGDRISGTVSLSTCQTIELNRIGSLPQVAIPSDLRGLWSGTGGSRDTTAIALDIVTDGAMSFAELRASYPAHRTEPERDRLQLGLVPMAVHNQRVLFAPVGWREYHGIFEFDLPGRRHTTTQARAFVVGMEPDGQLGLWQINNANDLVRTWKQPPDVAIRPNDRDYLLSQSSSETAQALAHGELPPLAFGGAIGGLLASAPSREAQCRVLDDWIAPYYTGVGGASRDSVTTQDIIEAFTDPVFESVFGVPYPFTSQADRTQVHRFILETCVRGQGVSRLGLAVQQAFQSEHGFARINSVLANVGESIRWLEDTLASLPALPDTAGSLQQIETIRREASQRARELSADRQHSLMAALDRRSEAIQAAVLGDDLREMEALATNPELLMRLGNFMTRLERAQLTGSDRQALSSRAAALAEEVAKPVYLQAAHQAEQVPSTLEGLAELRRIRIEIQPIAQFMRQHFIEDRQRFLAPLTAREQLLWQDRDIQQALRATLLSVEAGNSPAAAVRAEAARYLSAADLERQPVLAALVDDSILQAELRTIRITDQSPSPEPGEPTAHEIAQYVFERVQDYNRTTRSHEAECASGNVSNPIVALRCLQQISTWTGEEGLSVRLKSLTKIGCRPEHSDTHYRCLYTQELQMSMPMSGEFGLDGIFDMVGPMSGQEVTEALFIRRASGGWTVITGRI